MASVSVVEDAQGVSRLRVDNRQQEGSSASLLADARQALLPVLLHPSPRRALFLGLGTGVTATSAAQDRKLQVDAVELLPEVIDASAHFQKAVFGEDTHPRLHVMAGDARRFVRAGSQAYDLIVSDNFHPARSGSGSLYTVEHFQAVRARLADGGVFCQWLPLHQLDIATLRSIVASFLAAYPDGWALLATNSLQTPVIGLVGRSGAQRFDIATVRSRLSNAALGQPPARFGIADDYALLGSFVAGPRSLARFAQGAALNTDDHPVVAYQAPRITYMPDTPPADRLITLLHEWRIEPDELMAAGTDDSWRTRLSAYWVARQRFIEAGRNVQPSGDVQRMLAQVREPLLEVLRISPDFQPAADPLLRMAQALSVQDAAAGQALRDEVMKLRGR
jgi:spermidine synthase